MLKMDFAFKKETKTCFVFESGEKPDFTTLYLKKTQVQEAGIDPANGITITVEQKGKK